MNKRMLSVLALTCALLLLLSSASLAKSSLSSQSNLDIKNRIGARAVERPQPTMGVDPGDDDTPDKGGEGDVGDPANNNSDTVRKAGNESSRSLKDWWETFRLQLLTVLRVWK